MSEIPYMMENTPEEFERVRNLAWPRPPTPALSEREAAIVAVFKAAPYPAEVTEAHLESVRAVMSEDDRAYALRAEEDRADAFWDDGLGS